MKKTIILSLGLFLVLSIQAQNKLTAESLWKLGRLSLEHVSPDGKMVAYTVTQYDVAKNKGNANVYVIEVASGNAKQITNTEASEGNVRFRPDGRKIAFLRGGKMYEANLDGTEEKLVLDKEINGFLYSPASTHILTIEDVKYDKTLQELNPTLPEAKARVFDGLMYRHWNAWEDGLRSNLFIYPYSEGKVADNMGRNITPEGFDTPLNPFGGIEQMAWSPKGKAVAYTCKKLTGTAAATSTNSDIYLYDLASDKTLNLSEKNTGYDMEPVFQPNGAKLIWSSMATPGYEADRVRMMSFSLAEFGKSEEYTVGFDNNAEHCTWSSDSKKIYFIGGDKGTKQVFVYDTDSKAIKQLTKGVWDYGAMVLTESGLVASRTTMANPAELYKIDVNTGEATQLTYTNKDVLSSIKMGEVRQRWVKTTDGKDMLVWVILPPDFDASKKYPTLLYCQGGPQSVISQSFSYRWNFQLMAANGYIVVAPCRRGMPTFGQAWNDQIGQDWGGQCMQDYFSAIDEMKKEPYVNADKLGAVGASFGGYSVYWLAGNHQKRFKAFISHCGMFNMESWYATTEEMFFANYDFGGAFWDPKYKPFYVKASPHNYVQNWDTPILVIHGEKDFRVPVSEGFQAFQAAQLKGIPSRLLTFPDEGHWISTPQNSLLWQKEFFAWLDKYLK